MDKKEESRDVTLDASLRSLTLDASRCSLTRESIEEAEAIAGGCMEMGGAGVTAEEALEAEESFLSERIRRAKEWQEELERRAKAAKRA